MSFEVNRRLVARRPPMPTSASVDPVSAGIIRGAFETICFEVATHLGSVSATVRITVEVEAESDGFDDRVRRTVSENASQLGFDAHEFEK